MASSFGMTRGAITLVNRRDRQVVVARDLRPAAGRIVRRLLQHARPLLDQVVLSGQALVVTTSPKTNTFATAYPGERRFGR